MLPNAFNPVLADAFKRIGLVERTGRGIDTMFEGQLRYGRPVPDYPRSSGGTVQVVLAGGPANLALSRFHHRARYAGHADQLGGDAGSERRGDRVNHRPRRPGAATARPKVDRTMPGKATCATRVRALARQNAVLQLRPMPTSTRSSRTRSSRATPSCAFAATGALLVVLLAPPVAAQTPSALVQRAVAAIGGESALRALANTNYEFNAAAFSLGQEETPASPARATLSYGRLITDYRASRRLTTQESRAVTGVVTRQRRILAGGIGLTETNGAPNPDAAAAVAAALVDMRLLPDQLLLRALDNPSALTALRPRPVRGEMMDGVRFAHGADTVSLWFDRFNGVLVAAERVTDDGVLGDRRNTVLYTRWAHAGGVKLPREIDSEANGRLVQHTVITSAVTNARLDDAMFAIPDSLARRAARGPVVPTQIVVTLADVGENVWRAEGQTHHSLIVKQGNGLLVVEMPQSSARSKAVLDTLASRFPGVPVRTAVSTHHHWDHSGGVREYLARGIPVVTHARNVTFLRGIATARKTIAPDALSRSPRVPAIRAASSSLSIGSGDTKVEFFELPNTHAEGLLVAYMPSLRILFVADVIQPGPGMSPAGCREVMAMVQSRGITVDRVVGAHAGIVSWADVVAAAAR